MRPRTKLLVLVACALIAVSVAAQAPPDLNGPVMAGAMGRGVFSMHFESNMDAAPVKGVPFCATISTEHTQSFADGNRIHSSDSSTLCRDSEGRTRREAGLNLLGAGPEKSPPKLITILDPVAGVRYMLDPENKTAHRMSLSAPGPGAPPDLSKHVMVFHNGAQEVGGGSTDVFYHKAVPDHEAAGTTENLGDQTINGIHAMGTRMTHTIPAGQMGNDKPIVVTSERWYSQDLKATVMTKHDDPWAGELKTEFTSVNTAEPDASLFTVPGDYKIVDDKDGPIMMHRFMAPAPQ